MRKNTHPRMNNPLAIVEMTSRERIPETTNSAQPTRKRIQPTNTNRLA